MRHHRVAGLLLAFMVGAATIARAALLPGFGEVAGTVAAAPNYTGGHTIPGARVEACDQLYPAGAGRQIVERNCIVCHGVNFLPGRALDRAGWQAFVHYMTRETAFRSFGMLKGPSLVDPARLDDKDLQVVLDYLAQNFGCFTPRAAGVDGGYGGYGGAASVLYPDKDAMTTLGAYYSSKSSANHLARFKGSGVRITGTPKLTKPGPQNPDMAGERFVGRPAGVAAPAAKGGEGRLVD